MLISVKINNVLVQMEFDSGAGVSLMPLNFFKVQFLNLPLRPCQLRLHGVSGPIKVASEVLVDVFCPKTQFHSVLPLIVCDSNHLKYPFGRSQSPSLTKAICNAPKLSNLKEMRSFLGLFNFYSSFLSSASTILTPLRQLTEK